MIHLPGSTPGSEKILRPVHPFPARMAPSIALDILRTSSKPLRVLDPMAGSGTTLVVAKSCGHIAIGFDSDPLAVLLAKAWCTDVDPELLMHIAERTLDAAHREARNLSIGDAYPCPKDDDETRAFIRYWFDETNRLQLTSLARAIRRRRDPTTQTLLWCAFSRMIIAKAASVSLANDVPHSRPHRVRDRSEVRAFDRFLPAVQQILVAAPFKVRQQAGQATVQAGDARRLPVDSDSIDVIVTSPPYLNAIDYIRCSKFSLVWMGHSIGNLRAVRATSIGTEVGLREPSTEVIEAVATAMTSRASLPMAEAGMLRRYIADMHAVMAEASRVLIPGGEATFVVGNSTVRGVFVQNSEAVRLLGVQCGLKPISSASRPLPDNLRYLPPPSRKNGGFESRMRTEVILKLQKPERVLNCPLICRGKHSA